MSSVQMKINLDYDILESLRRIVYNSRFYSCRKMYINFQNTMRPDGTINAHITDFINET